MKISLLKLIDVAILPSVLAATFKIFGLIISTHLFGSELQINTALVPYFVVTYPDTETYILVNTFSHLLLSVALVMGLSWLIVQAYHFHSTHIPPPRSAAIEKLGLSSLVSESFVLYHRTFVWVSLLWLATFISLIEGLSGTMLIWVGVVLFVTSLVLSAALVSDLKREFEIQKGLEVG